jgi:transcriptional regulator with XRE-family HTH domain/tetratricopeptide (TPR) repeat protein
MAEQPEQPAALIVPAGGLPPLPASLWRSFEVRQASQHNSPGTVVAIARRAHGLRQDELGTMAGFSQSAISRLEAGSNLAYDTRILRTLQRLLGIPAHLLGLSDDSVVLRPSDSRRLLADTPPAGWAADVDMSNTDMSTILSGATLQALCAAMAFGRHVPAGQFPMRGPISADVIGHLRVARRIINDADNWRASAALKPAARQLYELTDQLRRTATGALRQQLLGLQALYAEFYGWLHEETGNLRSANRWTTRALQQGQAADDRDIVAYAYIRLSQLAEVDDDPDQVIGLARAALREQGISPRVRALALQQQALGYAEAGNERCWRDLVEDAAPLLENAEPTNNDEYEIGRWFDIEHLRSQQAASLLQLGHVADAIVHYERIRPRWGHVCLWQQGVHTAKLAVAHAIHGDYDQAAIIGHQALSLAKRSDSVLVTRELRKLRQWAQVPALTDLTDALQTAS